VSLGKSFQPKRESGKKWLRNSRTHGFLGHLLRRRILLIPYHGKPKRKRGDWERVEI